MADTAAKPEVVKRAKQGRSPAYPAITLEAAIKKAKELYDTEGKYPAPMSSAFEAWGFGAKSSGGRDTRASLKYFGLVTVEGDGETGKVKLTDDALRILLDEREDQTEKKAIIRRLATAPKIHKKLYEKFPEGIKSDATVEHYLVFEEGYNKSAAGELVTEFKATADYAEVFKPANVSVKESPKGGAVDQTKAEDQSIGSKPPAQPLGRKAAEVKIMAGERELVTGLLSKDASFRLVVSGNVGVKEIERLIAKLQLDKEILADEDGDEPVSDEQIRRESAELERVQRQEHDHPD